MYVVIGELQLAISSHDVIISHVYESPTLLNILKERTAFIEPLTHVDIRGIDDWAGRCSVAFKGHANLIKDTFMATKFMKQGHIHGRLNKSKFNTSAESSKGRIVTL